LILSFCWLYISSIIVYLSIRKSNNFFRQPESGHRTPTVVNLRKFKKFLTETYSLIKSNRWQ
jgi:hypothetical protein